MSFDSLGEMLFRGELVEERRSWYVFSFETSKLAKGATGELDSKVTLFRALKWGAMQGDQIDEFYQVAAWLWDSLIKIASRLWNCFRLLLSVKESKRLKYSQRIQTVIQITQFWFHSVKFTPPIWPQSCGCRKQSVFIFLGSCLICSLPWSETFLFAWMSHASFAICFWLQQFL